MTTPLAEIMNAIEQHRFSSELNLAAGTKAFRRGLRSHILFQQLAEAAKDPRARSVVAKRIEQLADEPVDLQYENRYDAALSAYLTVLADTAEPEVIAKAASASAKAANTWWAGDISRELITHAIATGYTNWAPGQDGLPETLFARITWPKAFRDHLEKMRSEVPVTARTVTGNQILKALHKAEVKAARVSDPNKVSQPLSSDHTKGSIRKCTGRVRGTLGSRPPNDTVSSYVKANKRARAQRG